MGGECNYLLRVGPAPERRLEFVPDGQWKSEYMMGWRQSDIDAVLDEAGALLRSTASHLRLPVQVRKQRQYRDDLRLPQREHLCGFRMLEGIGGV